MLHKWKVAEGGGGGCAGAVATGGGGDQRRRCVAASLSTLIAATLAFLAYVAFFPDGGAHGLYSLWRCQDCAAGDLLGEFPGAEPPAAADGPSAEDTSRFGDRASASRMARIVADSFLAVAGNDTAAREQDVRWFVMGDDDTVFFPDNLLAVLRKYDHEEMYHFIYTDELLLDQEADEEAASAMDLLVAADLYGLDRLRLMCERTLWERVRTDGGVGSAMSTLALVNGRDSCRELQDLCIGYVADDWEAAMATEYRELKTTCPALLSDVLEDVITKQLLLSPS